METEARWRRLCTAARLPDSLTAIAAVMEETHGTDAKKGALDRWFYIPAYAASLSEVTDEVGCKSPVGRGPLVV